ncbi:MAG: radical SAM protein [bacterium]|nr:radical SAM protein [bacterium]
MKTVGVCYAGYMARHIDSGKEKSWFAPKTIWDDLEGEPVLIRTKDQVEKACSINDILFFIQDRAENKPAIDLAKEWGLGLILVDDIECFEAYLRFFLENSVDIMVRFSPVIPLLDPRIIDQMVEYLIKEKVDLVIPNGFTPGTTPNFAITNEGWGKLVRFERLNYKKGELWQSLFLQPHIFKSAVKIRYLIREDPKNINLEIDNRVKLYLVRKAYKKNRSLEAKDVLKCFEEDPSFWLNDKFQIELELTNDCNLGCLYCPRSKMTRQIGYMSLSLYKKIVSECSRLGFSICLSGFGEPLLHPEFSKMIEYAKDRGLKICLYTNGVNLNGEKAKVVLGYIDELFISLDAEGEEVYHKIKGSPDFTLVVSNIHKFLSLKKEKIGKAEDFTDWVKPVIILQLIKMKENEKEIDTFWKRWDQSTRVKRMVRDELNKDFREFMPTVNMEIFKMKERDFEIEEIEFVPRYEKFEDKIKRLVALQLKRNEVYDKEDRIEIDYEENHFWIDYYRRYLNRFYKSSDLPIEWVVIQRFNDFAGEIRDRKPVDYTPKKRCYCRNLKGGISVFWDGRVVRCRVDFDGRDILGDLNHHTMDEILSNERLNEIRRKQRSGQFDEISICSNCKEWYYTA